MARTSTVLLAAWLGAAAAIAGPDRVGPARARAADPAPDWHKEFDAICGRTEEAMMLSTPELEDLVARADRLLPVVEKLGETERKVYLRRLQACRNLFAYVLETRRRS